MIVICVGGGGIPVLVDDGHLRGVEAVVDKDLSAALLASALDADALLMLTDVDAVYIGWGTAAHDRCAPPTPTWRDRLRPRLDGAEGRGRLPLHRATGRPAAIGSLADAAAIVRGEAGTRVTA